MILASRCIPWSTKRNLRDATECYVVLPNRLNNITDHQRNIPRMILYSAITLTEPVYL